MLPCNTHGTQKILKYSTRKAELSVAWGTQLMLTNFKWPQTVNISFLGENWISGTVKRPSKFVAAQDRFGNTGATVRLFDFEDISQSEYQNKVPSSISTKWCWGNTLPRLISCSSCVFAWTYKDEKLASQEFFLEEISSSKIHYSCMSWFHTALMKKFQVVLNVKRKSK